jgi:predicted nucleic acid-binding protein
MNKIIIDTNIVFSALLNTNSRIGQLLINGNNHYDFYSPAYLRFEIFNHKSKIKSIGKLSENEFIETFNLIIRKITILNHSIIPIEIYKEAEGLCMDIDVDDTVFVAVSKYLNGTLWTGDLKLINQLEQKGYKNLITTYDLYRDFLIRNKTK